MGEVFRARDTRLDRDVAIKLLPDHVATDPERRARFDREARTLAALNHPGIVTIHAIEEHDDHRFLVMEHVEGRVLSDLISKAGLPVERLLGLATQLAGAVAVAHKHSIVHRDLKPANVMVGAQDRVKVLDFGLAKPLDNRDLEAETLLPSRELTGAGRIVGTVSYMSPEQAEGRAVDERSDVFSIGVMLYEMATGERPFTGDSSLSILSAILRDTPRPLAEIKPTLPRELSRVIRRCLAKDPDERYQSAADLRNDLEDLRQSVLSGPLDASATAAVPPARRQWGAMAAIALLGGVAGSGAVLAWMTTSPASGGPISDAPYVTYNRLTLLEGVSQQPMISPDGRWVVYVSVGSGNQDIYLQSTTGQTPINLTKDSPANDSAPAFSPDGEQIVFRSERDGGGLFVMGRTGESVRRLTRHGYEPTWNPDGTTVIYTSVGVASAEARGGGIGEIWSVSAAGGEPRRLSAGDAIQPRVSPNGQRIAFWSLPTDPEHRQYTEANRDIWTITAEGTDPVRVTSHPATDWNPVWSPDGRWLYFLSNRSGNMNLWRVAIDQSTGVVNDPPQPVTVPAAYIRHFSLSSDGRSAAFATWNVTSNLSRVAFDERTASPVGAIQPLTTGPRDFQFLDVRPDGAQLVLATSFRGQEDLFLIDRNGTGLRNLTNDRFRDRAPKWSPDGQALYFYSDRGKNYEVYSIDRDGSGLRQLTDSGGQRYFPVPLRDGSKIVAADITTWQLFLYDPRAVSRPAELLHDVPESLQVVGGALTPTDWSPDNSALIGNTTGATTPFLWLLRSGSGGSRRVAPGANARWLSDGRRVIHDLQGRIRVTDTVTGESRDVLAIPGEVLTAPRVTPDGRDLFFLRGTQSGDIWLARFDDGADPSVRTP